MEMTKNMNTVPLTKLARSNAIRARQRRGISLVIVALLVSMTMAVSFAVIHTQGTAITSQQNSDLRTQARQAALTGMAIAIREAHSPNWIGTEVSFSKDLSETEHFNATYSTGDATLSDGDEDYDEYPYRVTILVTGHATDPKNTDIKASHRVEAVIRLVPEAVDDKPTGWNEVESCTFNQLERHQSVFITVPCHIEGLARIRSKLYLCQDDDDRVSLGWDKVEDVRKWYLEDLYYMSRNGWPDYRPFSGPVNITYDKQDAVTISLLVNSLHLTIHDSTSDDLYQWSDPLGDETYQLYPGGKTYNVQTIGGNIQNEDFKPDAKTNPLGIFMSTDSISFRGNVSMQGTLITRGEDDIEIVSGENNFSSLTVPPYEHRDGAADTRFRLPTIIGHDDCWVHGGDTKINGLAMFRQRVEVMSSTQCATAFTINGNLSSCTLRVNARSDWLKTKEWWNEQLNIFLALFYPASFFPNLVHVAHGLNPQPQIQLKPDSDQTRYHWYSGDNPLFKQPKDGSENDKGLAWEIIRWTDNP